MTAHVHLDNMRLYLEDAAETQEPWLRWRKRRRGNEYSEYPWLECTAEIDWLPDWEYERIPHIIGNIEVPAPEREPLEMGEYYWVVDLASTRGVCRCQWLGDETDKLVLSRGLVYRRKEDAQACADALIKLLTGGRDD